MNSIHRARIPVEDYQEVEMTGPPIAVAADRDGQDDFIDVWWEHYERELHYEARLRQRAIYIFGTGHPVPWSDYTRHAYKHIGTVVTPGGYLIWHVYTGPKHGEAIPV